MDFGRSDSVQYRAKGSKSPPSSQVSDIRAKRRGLWAGSDCRIQSGVYVARNLPNFHYLTGMYLSATSGTHTYRYVASDVPRIRCRVSNRAVECSSRAAVTPGDAGRPPQVTLFHTTCPSRVSRVSRPCSHSQANNCICNICRTTRNSWNSMNLSGEIDLA